MICALTNWVTMKVEITDELPQALILQRHLMKSGIQFV